MIYNITPVSKPRMTQRDKWKKRPCVLAYYAFKDECRLKGVKVPDRAQIVFSIPMPASWSQKKRQRMNCEPHQQRPDVDNLLKAVFDAVLKEDCWVYEVHARKVWSETGSIEITEITDEMAN